MTLPSLIMILATVAFPVATGVIAGKRGHSREHWSLLGFAVVAAGIFIVIFVWGYIGYALYALGPVLALQLEDERDAPPAPWESQ